MGRTRRLGVGHSITVGRSHFFDTVQAWFRGVGAVTGRDASTSNAGVSAAKTVGAGETTSHEEFGVERECSQMSGPFFT